jgi:hypothetical protein
MIDDRLQIDLFNPTTWTGDFGINKDGFRKDVVIDGSYTSAIDEEPVDYSDDLKNKPKDLSGNVYLKTTDPDYAPFNEFPARKFEYSDGTVTWVRPGQPWCWMGRGGSPPSGIVVSNIGSRMVLVGLIVLVILAYILGKLK